MMSFSWPGLQITLEHVFEAATGIPFVWEDEPRKIMTKPFGLLTLGQSIVTGRDYSEYNFDKEPSVTLGGYRELTITVQIFGRDARGDKSSRALVERARLALANPVYRDELRTAGLVFVETHPVADLDFSFDQRHEKRSAFDVVFRHMIEQQHAWSEGGYFSTVELERDCL
jgi:hypothetical protein